jgi:hypothetical protein
VDQKARPTANKTVPNATVDDDDSDDDENKEDDDDEERNTAFKQCRTAAQRCVGSNVKMNASAALQKCRKF